MSIYHWILLAGFFIFILSSLYHLFQIVKRAHTDDLSNAKGSILLGVLYSMTGAMLPMKKETAYLHLPTYIAGILYHIGSFFALFWLIPLFFRIPLPFLFVRMSIFIFLFTGLCGFFILLKRFSNTKLRHLSSPDDYFSNILVTAFHWMMAVALHRNTLIPHLFIVSTVLFLYIPIGKLRHIIYFFIARFYLGLFYGKRGVWPPNRRNSWAIKKL
ncbi:MAG: hypothetical protein ABIL68_11490 [bacterium]